MKSKLQKLKEYEINKSEQKNINGGRMWSCYMHHIGVAFVSKSSQVRAFQARGYNCSTLDRYKSMTVTG